MTVKKKVNGKTVREYIGEFIAFFVCLDSYLLTFQVSIASRHMAVALKLPIHNIGIYFSKLYSIGCLLMGFGTIVEYLLYTFFPYIRRYVSLISSFIKTFLRLAFVVIMYVSHKPSLHIYMELMCESIFFGIFQNSLFSIVPEYAAITSLSMDISFVVAFLLQVIFDLTLYKDPLLMIRIQGLIRFISGFTSLCLWSFYILKFDSVYPKPENGKELMDENGVKCEDPNVKDDHKPENTSFFQHFMNASSQFHLFGVTALFKDFLYPGIIPYALLERDRSHIINVSVPPFYLIGSLSTLVFHELVPGFKCWNPEFNSFWLLTIPEIFSFVASLMAIHTKVRFTKKVRGSRLRVFIVTLLLMTSYSTLESISFVGVADYVYYQSGDINGSMGVITLHNIYSILCRFLYTKLSVGYNDTRVDLGYHLPKFRPNHRMSDANTFFYILRNTFKRSLKDTVTDFKLNIKKYL